MGRGQERAEPHPRDLPFALAIELFDGRFIEQVVGRHDYGETCVRAIGMAAV